jgi:hypothetical protein
LKIKLGNFIKRNTAAPAKEVAMKARDILRNTFPTDRKTARFVSPARVDDLKTGWRVITVTKVQGQKPRLHAVTLKMPKGFEGTLSSCRDVKIDCDCERYTFVWNFALNEHGAAIKDRTNGEAPVITNPNNTPGCCKHSLVAIGAMLRLNPRWPTRKVTNDQSPGYGKAVRLTNLREAINQTRKS